MFMVGAIEGAIEGAKVEAMVVELNLRSLLTVWASASFLGGRKVRKMRKMKGLQIREQRKGKSV
jgi:hypothetical protein